MKNLYQTEMRDEIASYAHLIKDIGIFTQADIAHLPMPLQRYFEMCGYIGTPKMVNAEVLWADSAIKMGVDKPWMPLKTYQFNSVPRPFRIAYMQAKIMGIIPFEGRDIYTSKQGNMRGQLMKFITLFDNHDKELAQSGLATTFAEAVLIPSYILQPYISWQAVDDKTVNGCIEYNGLQVAATFYFDDTGKFTRFYTEDRYMALPKREYVKIPFSAYIGDYIQNGDVQIPSKMSAVWHLESGDFEYFRGTISGVRHNIT
ncbi:MAG: hypothetical protein KJ043_06450 [Anaerolineae bacterium]|nr:hypothetical protein [Anaerolineae bacterium]